MLSLGYRFNDEQIAAVVTYVRNVWGNAASPVSAETIKPQRAGVTGAGTRTSQLARLALTGVANHLMWPKEFRHVGCYLLPPG